MKSIAQLPNKDETLEALLVNLDDTVTRVKASYKTYLKTSMAQGWATELGEYEHLEKEIEGHDSKLVATLDNYLIDNALLISAFSTICRYCLNNKDTFKEAASIGTHLLSKYKDDVIFNSAYLQSGFNPLFIASKYNFVEVLKFVASSNENFGGVELVNLQMKHAVTFAILRNDKINKKDLLEVYKEHHEQPLSQVILKSIEEAYRMDKGQCLKFTSANQHLVDSLLDNTLFADDHKPSFKEIVLFILDNKHLSLFTSQSYINGLHKIYEKCVAKLQSFKQLDVYKHFEKDVFWHIACSDTKEFESFIKDQPPQAKSLCLLTKLIVQNDTKSFSLRIEKPLTAQVVINSAIGTKAAGDKLPSFKLQNNLIEVNKKANTLDYIDFDDWNIIEPLSPEKTNKEVIAATKKSLDFQYIEKEYANILQLFDNKALIFNIKKGYEELNTSDSFNTDFRKSLTQSKPLGVTAIANIDDILSDNVPAPAEFDTLTAKLIGALDGTPTVDSYGEV